mmetsp:Transcript_77666/g.142139  ORF Transcript_77666/g.142139 Transcript_77666/m.142139 type:complete len:401 (+) Transcript_77666:70-1272(+)
MWSYLMFGSALALAAMLTLQGCGGGSGGGDKPEPSTGNTTSITSTTTSTTMTGTKARGPTGLYWCEDIDTFYKLHYQNGTKSAAGQCLPSKSPGAYYTSPGEKADDGKSDKLWQCFSPETKKSLWTDEEAKAQGFTGACLFKDYGNQTSPQDVDACNKYLSHHPAVCAPGPKKYWGACWSSHSENWKCIPQKDPTIQGLVDGDCKANVVLEPAPSSAPTNYFFDGVCRFKEENDQIYKCDTVPGYSEASSRTCGQKVDSHSDEACFSLKSGETWQCMQAKPCFENNTRYAPDMPGQGPTKEDSVEKCQARCARVPGCVHFTFATSFLWRGACHLQNSTSKPESEKGVTAGPPSCPEVHCDWTTLPGKSTEFYKGFCVFPKSPQYENATDAHNLTTASLIV